MGETMTDEDSIRILNELLTKAVDAEQSYEQAANSLGDSPALTAFFARQRNLRTGFGRELESAIRRLGGQPDRGASAAARTHGIWITLRNFGTGVDEQVVLDECARGEKAALKEYDEILDSKAPPPEVAALIEKQQERIAHALTSIRVRQVARG